MYINFLNFFLQNGGEDFSSGRGAIFDLEQKIKNSQVLYKISSGSTHKILKNIIFCKNGARLNKNFLRNSLSKNEIFVQTCTVKKKQYFLIFVRTSWANLI